MKSLKLTVAAAVLAGTLGAIAPAVAQDHRTVVVERHTVVTHREGWRNHHRRQVCTTHWRHHQRVRRCHWA